LGTNCSSLPEKVVSESIGLISAYLRALHPNPKMCCASSVQGNKFRPVLGSRVNGKVKIHMDGNGVYRDLVQYSKPQRKQMDFNDLKRLNSISLCIAITVLCLPGAFLGVRSLL